MDTFPGRGAPLTRRALLMTLAALGAAGGVRAAQPGVLPAFPQARERWLNSPPLDAGALAGRPVLVEFWTFGCENCQHTLPWLRRVYDRYAPRGLVVVGVHTPEFAVERDPARVAEAVHRLSIAYPVVTDPDGAYWQLLDNRYWPSFYLYDSAHRLRAHRDGEQHTGEDGADRFEREIVAAIGG